MNKTTMQTCWYKKLIKRVRRTKYYNIMSIEGEQRNGVSKSSSTSYLDCAMRYADIVLFNYYYFLLLFFIVKRFFLRREKY